MSQWVQSAFGAEAGLLSVVSIQQFVLGNLKFDTQLNYLQWKIGVECNADFIWMKPESHVGV